MIGYFKRRANRRLIDYVRSRFDRIVPIAGSGLFNYQCHRNSVQYVLSQEEPQNYRIFECIYIDDGEPILHYVVYDKRRMEYVEVTLGVFVENYPEFYKIREVHPSDYMSITSEFNRAMAVWKNQFVPALLRPFIDRIV